MSCGALLVAHLLESSELLYLQCLCNPLLPKQTGRVCISVPSAFVKAIPPYLICIHPKQIKSCIYFNQL